MLTIHVFRQVHYVINRALNSFTFGPTIHMNEKSQFEAAPFYSADELLIFKNYS